MALISEKWPFITPWNVETLELQWWAYYGRAAEHYLKQQKEVNRGR